MKEKNKAICPICMENHDTKIVSIVETNFFKGVEVTYKAAYYFCCNTEEYYTDEILTRTNDIAMKDSYRKAVGLLASDDIKRIRTKYNITQKDIAIVLGLGEKTITRYESHCVQERAIDLLLKKIDADPSWFLDLLAKNKERISNDAYEKSRKAAVNAILGQANANDETGISENSGPIYVRYDSFNIKNKRASMSNKFTGVYTSSRRQSVYA